MRTLLFLLVAGGCSSAIADQIAAPQPVGPRTALAIAPAKIRAPYDVQVVAENGETAPTYALRDRFYVMGMMGARYTIRITNPTARRVEAVVSVDGLDVIDGDAGDLHKRGYIVPPYGETRIEGFRTSLDNVATFRFSSVDGSYAGKQGKARNVGVIAAAIFEEQAPAPDQQMVVPNCLPGTSCAAPAERPYDWTDDLDAGHAPPASTRQSAKADKKARDYAGGGAATASSRPSSPGPTGAPAKAPAPGRYRNYDDDKAEAEAPVAQPTHRMGLGTEFGEQRYSAASLTRFVRAADRPVAVAELRYNDAGGLAALGIVVQPQPDQGEIMTRETADPFPGDHFARAPR
jgi:hypothetical protein